MAVSPAIRPLAFVVSVLVVHTLLYVAYTQGVAPYHRAFLHDAEFLAGDGPLEVLFVGDSHPRSAVEPRLLGDRALNLAVGGEHYLKTRYRLPWLLDRSGREVDTVVLPLESHSFVDWKVDAYAPEYLWGRYVPFLELGRHRGEPFAYLGRWLKAHVVPYAGELDTIEQRLAGGRGFRDRDTLKRAPTRDARRGPREAAALHFADRDPLQPDLRRAFHELVAELQARDIDVVLVSYPVSEPYAELAAAYGARPAVREQVLPALIEAGLPHLDHEGAFFGQPDAWYDGDHMSEWGRLRYTRQLAWALVDLGVIEAPEGARRPAP